MYLDISDEFCTPYNVRNCTNNPKKKKLYLRRILKCYVHITLILVSCILNYIKA